VFPSFSRRLAVTLSLVLAAITTASCSDFDRPPPPPRTTPGVLAFVVGGRNNMPKPQLPESMNTVVEDSIRSGDALYVVGVSGQPGLIYEGSTAAKSRKCDTVSACNGVVNEYRRIIKQKIADAKATTPEADTLEAIADAARAMDGSSGAKQIVVIDNGLQTTGEMPLVSEGALFTPPDELAQALSNGNRLERRLRGVDITWVGLGAAAPPQTRPDQRPRNNLEALWTKVLTTAGATVHFVGGIGDGPPGHEGMPPVTVVPVKDKPIEPAGCAKIREDQVGFIPGRADFWDPAVTRVVLEPIAEALIDGKRAATLVGYVALPEDPTPDRLSLRRAIAVKTFLVSLGVPESSLTAEGAGTPPEYPTPPAEPKPTELQQYRRVEVHVPGHC
jgi:hypothetical protein